MCGGNICCNKYSGSSDENLSGGNEDGSDGFVLSHLCDKNSDVAKMGHPIFVREQRHARGGYSLLLTRENVAPWGSWPLMIQLLPGTCMGPLRTWPPPALTRLMAAPMESTLK